MNPFWKDIFREIWGTKGRFVSMLLITMLGATLVTGIRATAINMRDAANAQYQAGNLYDLQLRSPVGFSQEAVDEIRAVPGVYRVMPSFIVDVYIDAREVRRAMRVYSLPDGINNIRIVEGRLPAAYNEIAVELRLLREGGHSIGDVISFANTEMPRFLGVFATNEFIITGVAESPLYITNDRGNTTLGAGTLRFSSFLHSDGFSLPVYTDVYVIMAESQGMHQVSSEYNAAALEWRRQMEDAVGGFVLTRQNGIAFESYFQDSLRLEQVGNVLPLLFFLVAALVALTGISRMIEDQRGQIGIYKALGYKTAAILAKYAIYALACGAVGGILGVVLGSQVIPRIVFDAYGHLYNMPHSNHPVPWDVAFITVGASIACVLGTALLTCINALKGEPASLMRPKAPKAGKRVILEFIPFLWRRLGFVSKVTSRNIFRYKRRFFMSLTGVAGCTALVLVAFGLRDSIGSVARLQFEDIIAYDFHVHMMDIGADGRAELLAFVDGDYLFIRTTTADAHTDMGGWSAALIIPEDFNAIRSFVSPLEPMRGLWARSFSYVEPYGEGVLVTEKLARDMGVHTGDYFNLVLGGNAYRVRAAGIVENYVLHYIYMPPDYYFSLFGREPVFNGFFVKGDAYVSGLLYHDAVLAVVSTESMRNSLSGQTDALGVVTIVILVMACMLAFVVLYNLTEINIIERMREIATIKVLGFYDTETAMYLYRENMVVTGMGIVLGLVGGIFLNSFVLTTVEIDLLKFPHIIFPSSFVLSAAISVFFALCVNAATYRRLIAIDMVAALKSVE